MKWQKKLNKTELKHFRKVAKCTTLQHFKDNRESQHKLDSTKEVCYECRHIAIKLGLEK